MKKALSIILIALIILSAGSYLLLKGRHPAEINTSISVSKAMSGGDTAGYERAIAPRKFTFPEDYGPHPGFKTEWWYFTGNLDAEGGRHFGYQLTIFRTAISPDTSHGTPKGTSPLRSNQVYMGHFTLTDVSDNKFYNFERFSRGAEKLAGAAAVPFHVWLEDWQISEIAGEKSNGIPVIQIKAEQNGISINLTLRSMKPVVLQGDHGFSRKGPEEGNASYYYSLTRLQTDGTVKVNNDNFTIKGLSWMDRERSTSALSRNQAGWDWFSLQLSNSKEIMYYQMRLKTGAPDRFSQGVIVNEDGQTEPVRKEDVKIEVTGKWTSPSGGEYPSGWKLSIPSKNIYLEIIPYIRDQELTVSIRYWEGAVKIKGNWDNRPVNGSGYVELTGYGEVL
ncbi:MAG TPA: lipocalin-like domain-containing protein [Ignavibacteriales bacterium]|nr:lipocalin-like domain-containing protein [Ignavibacteriales bacterium]